MAVVGTGLEGCWTDCCALAAVARTAAARIDAAHFHGMVVPPGESPVFKANLFVRIASAFLEESGEDGD